MKNSSRIVRKEALVEERLRGVSCLLLVFVPPDRKSASCSKSFGRRIEPFEELGQAVAEYASRVAVKVRRSPATRARSSPEDREHFLEQFTSGPWYGVAVPVAKGSAE